MAAGISVASLSLKAPLPANEAARIRALHEYAILDTPEEQSFDDIAKLASFICEAPIALISLVDGERQWFKSRVGLQAAETPREHAFCAHAILQPEEVLIIEDATQDQRFYDNPLVTGDPNIRFYAGAPLLAPGGEALGTICVVDRAPHQLAPGKVEALRALSRLVVAQLELRRISAELEKMDRLKSEFVSTVSHELRTPITAIRGSLKLLHAGTAGVLPESAAKLVGIAESSCERLVRLVNDILDIEKIAAGKLEFHLTDCDLVQLARQSLAAMEAYAAERRVKLKLNRAPPEARALADPDRVIQVLTNLISNATRFSPEGGAVEVGIASSGARHRVSVRDHGPGVAPQFRARLFQSFAQADAPSARATGGTGLGLAISKSIVERLGGSIGFEPCQGGGSVFFFEFPDTARHGAGG
jgi:signal transduction histidine kinase